MDDTKDAQSYEALARKEEVCWQAFNHAMQTAETIMLKERGISLLGLREKWMTALHAKTQWGTEKP